MEDTERVVVYFHPRTVEKLDNVSEKYGWSRSEVVRRCVDKGLPEVVQEVPW